MSTRSPTTIKRLGDSSGMGSSIHPRGPAGLDQGRNGDVDHVPRLTAPRASLLMRACRRGSRGPPFPVHAEGTKTCKTRLARLRRSSGAGFCRRYGAGSGAASPGSSIGRRSYSERCSTVIPSGRSSGRSCCSSFRRWCSSRASGARWSRSTLFRSVPLAPAGGAVDRLHPVAVLVRHRGHDLHVHAASDDERAALGLDGLPGERAGPGRAPVVLPVHHHRGQLRLHPGAERGDQDSRHRADRLDGAGRAGGRPVRGALLVPRADRCHHAVAGPAGVPAGHRRDTGAGPPGVGGCPWHDVVLVRPVRHAGAARHPGPEGDGGRGCRAGGRDCGRGVLERADQRAQGRARVVQEGGPAPDGAADAAGAAARRERVQLLGRRDHGQAALRSAVPVAGSGAPQHADLRDRQDPHGRGRCAMRRRVAALALALSVVACSPSQRAETPRSTLVIGLDISGSFRRNASFSGAIEFASLYIYGHLNGVGGLQPNTAIFVGELGGERTGQAKVFHPIQDLSGKTPAQIATDLRAWFPQEDPITDFNAFFQRAALHVKRNNLVLAPLNVVLFSDGEPDYPGAGRMSLDDRYKRIDLSPLEYLSRNVTVRLLYADPPIAQLWENKVPRKRVRLWTQDSEVMKGWRRHMVDGAPMQRQDSLWSWVDKVVDVRVRRERVL